MRSTKDKPFEGREMLAERNEFGRTPDGQVVTLFTLTNQRGYSIQLTDYGAILVSVNVPDRAGKVANINLGYTSLDGYLTRHPYFGSTVGRFCNRIAAGQFTLDGRTYKLAINNGPNHLHGGSVGFDKMIWCATEMNSPVAAGVQFHLRSNDGNEGYPGNLDVVAEYSWNDANELAFTFRATTDKPTIVNLTNHAYWNLGGVSSGAVLDHQLQLNCDRFLAVDETLIPTGEFTAVSGTPLDFQSLRRIGERIAQLPATKGYDHCFIVDGEAGSLRPAARAVDPASGRVMEVLTTQPGMQLYTGNHLELPFVQHAGFCLETQHYPDAPNHPSFPTTRLNPGEQFEQTTVHRFSVE